MIQHEMLPSEFPIELLIIMRGNPAVRRSILACPQHPGDKQPPTLPLGNMKRARRNDAASISIFA
jgi:hypothetical protein